METVVSILLYIQVLHSPSVVTVTHIQTEASLHATEVQAIYNDPAQLEKVLNKTRNEIKGITVIDDTQIK